MSFKDQELPPILKKVMKASNSEFLLMVIFPVLAPCTFTGSLTTEGRELGSRFIVNGITGRTRTKGYIIVKETFHLK